jgi:serine-type D-Ala-D-Ala carboxypeptidase (penicillin-binding protein 5/6)
LHTFHTFALQSPITLIKKQWLIGIALCFTASIATAQTAPKAAPVAPTASTGLVTLAPAPSIAGKSWLLLDVTSGRVLTAQNDQARVEPASLTKLMTAYLVFSALRDKKIQLTDRPPVSEAAYKAIGSRMFVDPKAPATVDELLNGMIVQSGNDASVILAEAVGGTETAFAQMMNREAQKLGMKNTNFTNAAGLTEAQHYSTAADLATLAVRLIKDFPQHYPLYSKKSYSYNNISQENRNRLLAVDPSVDGVKTGFTEAAGYCLIASSQRDQAGFGARRLLSVVLGTDSMTARATESQKLLAWGFQNFELTRVLSKDKATGSYEVWKGTTNIVKGSPAEDLIVTVPKGQADQVKAEVERNAPLLAPLTKGQRIGTIRIKLNDQVIAERALVAEQAVEQSGILGRTWDSIRLWLK